ncbi:MAG: phosphate acyltransferase PlsX [Gorillibacterium sp.]|nr:phosphate acyltransferase PlsX [Gorillibacterium sp.]
MRIAIDAMGGDNAPEAVVEGAIMAARAWPDTEIILVGKVSRIEALLRDKPSNLTLVGAEDVIASNDEPVKAVRNKKDSSMVVAARLVREQKADAFISAGNTGALLAAGLLIVGRVPGIDRPALAPMIPTIDGVGTLALDIGANMDVKPENLLQFALMGSIFRTKVDGIASPRVGLLNVGAEESKGNELTKAAYPLLKQAPIHFIGNVEARDVLAGECDVLVCDGFAGNILLKSLEGTAGTIFKMLKQQFTKSTMNKLAAAVLAPGLREFKKKLDYTEHGGAPMLGLNGLVLKSHGSSNAIAIMNAVRQARTALSNNLVEAISAEIGKERE